MDIVATTKPHLDELKKFFKVDRNGVVRTLNESLNEYQTIQEKLLHEKDKKIAIIKKDLGFRDKAFYALKATYDEGKITQKKLLNEKNKIIEKRTEDLSLKKEECLTLKSAHHAVNTKFSLISNLLSAKQSDNQGLAEFKRIFSEDFIDFANKESSLAEEARMILDLQNIEHELDLIVNTEGIASKNIIAIGGGFSSGKSAFVSSFFKSNEIELPIGINPVTAIPSYITSGNKDLIKGLSKKGGSINISTSLYKELSHDFVKSFDFNLKDIMPAMVIETEIEKYDQICFIDTPGYNPAATDGFTSEDKNTAQEFLEQANTLLWLIGLDSNGTIGQTDLDFLEALDLYDKELYIIANKADLRAESDLEDILDEIEESLEDCDIPIAGGVAAI